MLAVGAAQAARGCAGSPGLARRAQQPLRGVDEIRFDVVGVTFDRGGDSPTIEHIRDAF